MSRIHPAPAGTRLYLLHHGSIFLDARRLLLKREFFQTRSSPAPRDLWVPAPILTALIDHPEGRILFDTGPNAGWEDRWAATGQQDHVAYLDVPSGHTFRGQLAEVAELEALDLVVVSHLHMDHAGNLEAFGGLDTPVVVQEAEYRHAMSLSPPGCAGYVRREYEGKISWRVVRGDVDSLMTGVSIISLPGHTPGTQGLVVRLKNSGTILLASDAVYTLESLGPPPIPSAFVHDSCRWQASVDRLETLRNAEAALIVAGHDAVQLPALRLGPSQWYD